MATSQVVVLVALALLFNSAFAPSKALTTNVVKGFVTCLDCPRNSDLSGIQVLVECNKVYKRAVTDTGEDGTFKMKLPSDSRPGRDEYPSKCVAKIMGGPQQLYVSRKNYFLPIVKTKESSGEYTIPEALAFYKECPVEGKCGEKYDEGLFGSAKTVDLPLPREWGLAPSSYYIPFFPIIGIP